MVSVTCSLDTSMLLFLVQLLDDRIESILPSFSLGNHMEAVLYKNIVYVFGGNWKSGKGNYVQRFDINQSNPGLSINGQSNISGKWLSEGANMAWVSE